MNNNQTLDWIKTIANDYDNPPIGIECNGIGQALVERLYYEVEYDKIISTKYNNHTKKYEIYEGGIIAGSTLGIKTTNNLKLSGGDLLRNLFENNLLIIHDIETISEFKTFIKNKSTYQAEKGHTDDIAMTYLLFAWLTGNEMFRDIIDNDDNNTDKHIFAQSVSAPIVLNKLNEYTSMEDFLKN